MSETVKQGPPFEQAEPMALVVPRQPISVSAAGREFPLLITAGAETNSVEWIGRNKAEFEQNLVTHGAVLLRGFAVQEVKDFNDFMQCFDTAPLPYMFRSSPRVELDKNIKNIFTSTTYPNDRRINLHNENSYSRVWNRKIVFCCLQPALKGGETPIADCRNMLQDLPAALTDQFRRKGVKYRRKIMPLVGMPWQEVFQTEEPDVVRAICAQNRITCQFIDEDELVLEWVKAAITRHPVSGEETWFNHVSFFHKYSRLEELGLDHGDFLPEDLLTSETFFGDGSEITYDDFQAINAAYRKNTIAFPYQQGDILFLDNMLTAHGRNAFEGPRTIATAMSEAVYEN